MHPAFALPMCSTATVQGQRINASWALLGADMMPLEAEN
jgi:hypothetical protein